MSKVKNYRLAIGLLVAVPWAEIYSFFNSLLNLQMEGVWRVNFFLLIVPPTLVYYFCRKEKREEILEKEILSSGLPDGFWGRVKHLGANLNRFLLKAHLKNLFLGNLVIFCMAVVYLRLATMTLGLKRQPWKFLPGFVPGLIIKLFVAQKTGELFAQAVRWFCSLL